MAGSVMVDAAHHTHHKFLDAGLLGSVVVERMWCAAKLHDSPDGEITQFWNWRTIAHWTNMESLIEVLQALCPGVQYPSVRELAEEGMRLAIVNGLVEMYPDPDRRVFIHDWEDYQIDSKKAAAKRKRKQRARERVAQLQQQKLPYMDEDLERSEPGKLALFWMQELGVTGSADLVEWIDELEKLYRSGVDWPRMWAIVRHLLDDRGRGQWLGWRTVVQSPAKLRSKSKQNGQPYWEVIETQMETRNSGQRGVCLADVPGLTIIRDDDEDEG